MKHIMFKGVTCKPEYGQLNLSLSPLLRGSAELLEESGGNLTPADSMTSIPTCMPFSWFGDKERDRDREPSSSSSSLPYTATETSSEQSQDRKNKVCNFI